MINVKKELREGDSVKEVKSRPGGGTRVIVKNSAGKDEAVEFDAFGKYIRRVEWRENRTIAN